MYYQRLTTTYRALISITLGLSASVTAQDYTVPPMVNIPAGTFTMGNDIGNAKAKPAHQVTLSPFQLAKYPVTVKEFRQFVEDTGFNPTPSCNDFISASWFSSPDEATGNATWDKHRFQHNDFQPVTCISWTEANQYAAWLSKKTGIVYRLPTEQEYEYALKAGTTSRFYWGDDEAGTQACKYGNFADHSGEYFPSVEYGASYNGFLTIANCDDGEAYNSLVGLYRPNPFGLYDMVGNVAQYTSSCYYEGYQARTEVEMDNQQCEYISHRGGTWHFPPQPHADRGRTKRMDDTEWALMGFRLASDGHHHSVDDSTITFERELNVAQSQYLAKRVLIPSAPQQAGLHHNDKGQLILSWIPSNDSRVVGYDIYQSTSPQAHIMAGFYQTYYDKVASVTSDTHSIPVTLPQEGGSYRVVAKTLRHTSLPSAPISRVNTATITLPASIQMQDVYSLHNMHLSYRPAREQRSELFYLSKFHPGYTQPNVSASFKIRVDKAGWYKVNYRGRSMLEGTFFKIWSNNMVLAEIVYNQDIDDKTSSRHKIFLDKGEHEIQLDFTREGFDYWNLVWLKFSEMND